MGGVFVKKCVHLPVRLSHVIQILTLYNGFSIYFLSKRLIFLILKP